MKLYVCSCISEYYGVIINDCPMTVGVDDVLECVASFIT
jgi:hypothetical protein